MTKSKESRTYEISERDLFSLLDGLHLVDLYFKFMESATFMMDSAHHPQKIQANFNDWARYHNGTDLFFSCDDEIRSHSQDLFVGPQIQMIFALLEKDDNLHRYARYLILKGFKDHLPQGV
jgi:hypothetical protein